MKSLSSFIAVLFTSTMLLVSGINVAEAGRLGGGQSFGGKFSYSQPLKKDATTYKSSAQRPTAKPAQQHNSERKQQLAQKGGFMGMFGALALGGLLGALFFGGAFEGINFMDLLLFGMIAFLLFKFMARRSQPTAAAGYVHADMNMDDHFQQRQPATNYGDAAENNHASSVANLRSDTPRDFDQDAFVEGAKNCFIRLQEAWDAGDLADIREFTSDHVFGEIQDQYHARSNHSTTEIISLEAELLSATNLGTRQEAIVLFRGELQEDDRRQLAEEVWHFIKQAHGSWLLDGIQQVEG